MPTRLTAPREGNDVGGQSRLAWRWLPPSATPDAKVLLASRGVRAFADGFVSVLLPVYLVGLGFDGLQIGAVATATLVGSAALRCSSASSRTASEPVLCWQVLVC